MRRRLGTERFLNLYSTLQTPSISVSFHVVMVGASDLEGYVMTVVTPALFKGKHVDVTVSYGLATRKRHRFRVE